MTMTYDWWNMPLTLVNQDHFEINSEILLKDSPLP